MRVKKPSWIQAWPAADADAILPDGGVPPEKLDHTTGNINDVLTLDATKTPVWLPTQSVAPAPHTHPLADITDEGTMAAVDDAPSDGTTYGRKNGAWAAAGGGSGLTQAQTLTLVSLRV